MINYIDNLSVSMKSLRKAHKLSYDVMADFLDISKNTYIKWEKDPGYILNTHLKKIADIYKIHVSFLFVDKNIILPALLPSPKEKSNRRKKIKDPWLLKHPEFITPDDYE